MTADRYTAKEFAALIGLSTVCLAVVITVAGAAFRPIHPETREAVFQIVSSIFGLAAGLLAGRTGRPATSPAPEPVKTNLAL